MPPQHKLRRSSAEMQPEPLWLADAGFVTDNGQTFGLISAAWKKARCREWMEQVNYVHKDTQLVGGLEHFFIFPYIGNNHPNWLSYFSEGWPNHQPVMCTRIHKLWIVYFVRESHEFFQVTHVFQWWLFSPLPVGLKPSDLYQLSLLLAWMLE